MLSSPKRNDQSSFAFFTDWYLHTKEEFPQCSWTKDRQGSQPMMWLDSDMMSPTSSPLDILIGIPAFRPQVAALSRAAALGVAQLQTVLQDADPLEHTSFQGVVSKAASVDRTLFEDVLFDDVSLEDVLHEFALVEAALQALVPFELAWPEDQ
jgi:hypothetical protein